MKNSGSYSINQFKFIFPAMAPEYQIARQHLSPINRRIIRRCGQKKSQLMLPPSQN
jgi:hypothetical protein